MDCEETRIRMSETTAAQRKRDAENGEWLFQLNQSRPGSVLARKLTEKLFEGRIGEGSKITPPLYGAALENLVIGCNTRINSNLLAMSRGGITIGNDVLIAANVQLISNSHDLYDRDVLTCRPVIIEDGVWIGAGATVLPGVRIGKHAVIGAAAVVTKDIPDYAVAVGNPAHVIKMLDPERFNDH